jgi:methylenetetrahydrofolate--tRNA-(uracil-5-)-methyltransferase
MLGALCHYVTHADMSDFQPMKANFGILPPLEARGKKPGKRERGQAYAARALEDLDQYFSAQSQILRQIGSNY